MSISTPIYAKTVPIPETKPNTVDALNAQLQNAKQDKQRLQQTAQKAQVEYNKINKKLIALSASIQDNQANIFDIDQQLIALNVEQTKTRSYLKSQQASMAKMITALQRLQRTPPQALIAKPQAPIDAARAAMLLEQTLPAIKHKSNALRALTKQYADNEIDLNTKQAALLAHKDELKQQESELSNYLAQRKALTQQLNRDIASRDQDIKNIAKQAKDLNDLLAKLEQERQEQLKREREQLAREQDSQSRTAGLHSPRTKLPALGKSQLPLIGPVVTRYNQNDAFDAKSQGVTIRGNADALIVAPMGGTVRFAGFFKNYGNMVILEHENGYHSLIAGFENIDTVVNQNVSAGEPLGRLHAEKNKKPPTLYYELRYNGKAIDPARKFAELG